MSNALLPLLAHRLFETPMLMQPSALNSIASALSNRWGFAPQQEALFAARSDQEQPRKPLNYEVTPEGFAMIEIQGALAHRAGQISAQCLEIRSYESIREDFDSALNNSAVKSIIFEIDSPGGEAAGCFDLARHLLSQRGQKPMIAYVNEACYSAAYALACCCDQIIAPKSAGLGSVGVICGRLDQTVANKARGLNIELFHAGDQKADGHPHKPLQDDERARLQARIDALGNQFFELVAEARGFSIEVVKDWQASCLLAEDALDQGLCDEILSQSEFYHYLLSEKENTMFFSRKTKAPAASSAAVESQAKLYTQTEVDEQLAKQAEELQAHAKYLLDEQLAMQQTETEARLKSIEQACKVQGRLDLAAELMLSDLSAEQARAQLHARLSQQSPDVVSSDAHPDSPSSTNKLMDLCSSRADSVKSDPVYF